MTLNFYNSVFNEALLQTGYFGIFIKIKKKNLK